MSKLDHMHLILNANVRKPPTETEPVIGWIKKVIEAVGMKIVIGPYAHYCTAEENEGITAACCIETSHLSLHCWDKLDPAILRLDLYSCATFSPDTVLELLQEFEPYDIDYIVLDRNEGKAISQRALFPEDA